MQNFEKHELFCENMNFLTKFVNNWPNPAGNTVLIIPIKMAAVPQIGILVEFNYEDLEVTFAARCFPLSQTLGLVSIAEVQGGRLPYILNWTRGRESLSVKERISLQS